MKILKKNYKLIIGIILGLIISGISVYAAYDYYANEISYTNEKTVAQALNDLYTRSTSSKLIEVKLDGNKISEIPEKSSGYICQSIQCTGCEANFDYKTYTLSLTNITTANPTCTLNFSSDSIAKVIMDNMNNDTLLNSIFNNSETFTQFANCQEAVSLMCESSKLRNLMYNNYTVTQSIIRSNQTMMNTMKASDQYKNYSCSSYTRNNYQTIVNKKVFLFDVKTTSMNSTGLGLGGYLDGTANGQIATSVGTFTINKFMSTITGAKVNANNNPAATYYYFEI